MENKSIKVIFENGSMIFRKIRSYNITKETMMLTIVDGKYQTLNIDLIYIISMLGKFIKIKENRA